MNKILIGIATAATMIGTSAMAADMAVKAPPIGTSPVFNWAGCYLGADLGYAWQRNKDDEFVSATGAPSGFAPSGIDPHGVKGGGYLGCNWQVAPKWIIGIEGDAEGADVAHASGLYAPSIDFYQPEPVSKARSVVALATPSITACSTSRAGTPTPASARIM
jgi:opacity protein-like surface antigen